MDEDRVVRQVHAFMATQVGINRATGYRLLEHTQRDHFEGLPQFHLIVDYPSAEDLKAAFEAMRPHFRNDPHGPLMSLVTDFRVAESHDL